MKIFNTDKNYDSKVNFVDDNNVLVGYDTFQSCCEESGYYITENITDKIIEKQDESSLDLTVYVFDTEFFQELEDGDGYEEKNIVVFKLVAINKPTLYLHLFNCHNGYYSHGFEAKINDVKWQEGDL